MHFKKYSDYLIEKKKDSKDIEEVDIPKPEADSEIPLDLDALWEGNKELAAGLCLVLISPRFLGSPLAHSKREQILPWLSARLDQIESIERLPLSVLHDLYMHCSYADQADKHDIKKPINRLICRKLAQHNLFDLKPEDQFLSGLIGKKKPTMLVVLEWFGGSHSIYRTHSARAWPAHRAFHEPPSNQDERAYGN